MENAKGAKDAKKEMSPARRQSRQLIFAFFALLAFQIG